MRFQGPGKGLKQPRWQSNEIVAADDISYVGISGYQNFVDQCSILADVGKITGSTPDTVLSGLFLEWSSAMTCILRAGVAISFAGSYYNNDVWGFSASAGDAYAVPVAVDTNVVFSNGSGSNPRIDILEIQPTLATYKPVIRQYKDPITENVTSALTQTRSEFGFTFQIKQGTPAGSPVAPSTDAGWIKIAEVYVPQSASSISQSNIQDYRRSTGWTTSPVSTRAKPPNGLGTTFPLFAGYTPTIGDPVELVNGTVRKLKRIQSSVTLASGSALSALQLIYLDSTHFAAVYNDGMIDHTLKGRVFTLNADGSLTDGGSQTLWPIASSSIINFAACPLTASLFLFAWVDAAGGALGTVKVATCSVSGNTLTANSAVSGDTTSTEVALTYISSTGGFLSWENTTGTLIKAAVVSVSGTVPTINTAATTTYGTAAVANQITPGNLYFSQSGGGYAISIHVGSAADAHIYGWSIAGTSVTFRVDVDVGIIGPAFAPIETSTSYRALLWGSLTNVGNSSNGNFFVELSGGSVSPLGIAVCGIPPTYFVNTYNVGQATLDIAGGVFAIAYIEGTPANGTNAYVVFARRSAATGQVSYSDPISIQAVTLVGISCAAVAMDAFTLVAAHTPNTASQAVVSVTRRRARFVGVASDTIGTVQKVGVVSGFVGLTANTRYFWDQSGNMTTTPTDWPIGTAISTTQILLDLKPGLE